MKIRSDFVSNSSSCSFVLRNTNNNMTDAISVLVKAVKSCDIPYSFTDNITLYVRSKKKNCLAVGTYFEGSDFKTRMSTPYSDSADEIDYWNAASMNNIEQLFDMPKDILDMIEEIEFETDDCNSIGKFYLRLLYLFCVRNELGPDASNSEHGFCELDDFVTALATFTKDDHDQTQNNK